MQDLIKRRVAWIDILRGIAIILMIPANLSPLWSSAHPLWFRIAASYAAPAFIMLSTGMVILNANSHNFNYYLKRGLLVIGFGVFMDVCVWKIFPFITYDVLYLIGLVMPIIYLIRHFSTIQLFFLGLLIFFLTPFLQHSIGYHLEISEVALFHPYWPGMGRIIQALLIDGWFPVFPWLGIAIFGTLFFKVLF